MILTRQSKEADGVFGTMSSEDGSFSCVTLERSYDSGLGNGSYMAKVPEGTYICIRHAPNRLPYETFMLQHIPDFQGAPVDGILIHIGNYDTDSIGCVLLGRRVLPNPANPSTNMITSSRNTFNAFMDLQRGLDSFTLTVKDV